eukprot:5834014-Prorocentrum_lima.AAC.1
MEWEGLTSMTATPVEEWPLQWGDKKTKQTERTAFEHTTVAEDLTERLYIVLYGALLTTTTTRITTSTTDETTNQYY